MLARGIRNHNPLNIRKSKDQWKGMAEVQTDRAFIQFKSLDYGRRGNGDTGERHYQPGLLRHAARMAVVPG